MISAPVIWAVGAPPDEQPHIEDLSDRLRSFAYEVDAIKRSYRLALHAGELTQSNLRDFSKPHPGREAERLRVDRMRDYSAWWLGAVRLAAIQIHDLSVLRSAIMVSLRECKSIADLVDRSKLKEASLLWKTHFRDHVESRNYAAHQAEKRLELSAKWRRQEPTPASNDSFAVEYKAGGAEVQATLSEASLARLEQIGQLIMDAFADIPDYIARREITRQLGMTMEEYRAQQRARGFGYE